MYFHCESPQNLLFVLIAVAGCLLYLLAFKLRIVIWMVASWTDSFYISVDFQPKSMNQIKQSILSYFPQVNRLDVKATCQWQLQPLPPFQTIMHTHIFKIYKNRPRLWSYKYTKICPTPLLHNLDILENWCGLPYIQINSIRNTDQTKSSWVLFLYQGSMEKSRATCKLLHKAEVTFSNVI